MRNSNLKILYVCNDLEYFVAHRLKLAISMMGRGHEVWVASGNYDGIDTKLVLPGIRFIPTNLKRHSFSLFSDIALIVQYTKILREIAPDVIHTITIKPNLFMGLAATAVKLFSRSKSPKFVMTFAGLGKVFEPEGNWVNRVREAVVSMALKVCGRFLHVQSTYENAIDRDTMVSRGIFPLGSTFVLMGAGIDRDQFYPGKKTGPISILFASRLITSKGIDNFISAAQVVADKEKDIRFLVAGRLDKSNPDCIDVSLLKSAERDFGLEYLGEVDILAMAQLLMRVDVVCLPTRLREGFPRILLEAAACGCALISSDQPVMRQIVIPDQTGWLLNEPSVEEIASAIKSTAIDIDKTRAMGSSAATLTRSLPIDDHSIAEKVMNIYAG